MKLHVIDMEGIESLFKPAHTESLENTLADEIERVLYGFKIRILRSAAENTVKQIEEAVVPGIIYKLYIENQSNINAPLVFKYKLEEKPILIDGICYLSIKIIANDNIGNELYKHKMYLEFTINGKKLP